MPLDYAKLKNWSTPAIEQRYTERDTILYALGAGASSADLKYIFGPNLVALPTLATVLACDPLWLRNPALDIDWRQVVHGEQSLTMYKPLPSAGVVIGRSRVDEIYDKGIGKGAVLVYSIDLFDVLDNSHYATVGLTAFIRGQGGFGGCTLPAPKPHPLPEDRAPDMVLDLMTQADQAAIFRLTGDLNPMHIDPAAAREAGFERPVLHGLSYYGVAGRALLKLLCTDEPARLKKLNARFLDVVYPGETLRTEVWREGEYRAAFRVRALERDVIVLGNGYFEFSD
ncbi:MAG: maoC-like dehydratase [Verrucomicrobiaceae bacterium]|nr:maoC-like dehydratase [Verrucomicrobiaceae bacterium]